MSKSAYVVTAVALAGAMTSALAITTARAQQMPEMGADQEKCYGVALKGQNDCKAGAVACHGHSTVDYDPQVFKFVAKGTCTSMETPKGKGSLEPMAG